MELKDVKDYLRIDTDCQDDDSLLEALMLSAQEYIQNTTGKRYDDNDRLMRMCCILLVTHWYTNRSIEHKVVATQEYSHSITALLTHFSLSSAYAEV